MADASTVSQRFPRSNKVNSPYSILVQCNDKNISVRGWLPEEVMFDISTQYEAPYAQGLNGAIPGGNLLRALGVSLTTQAMTAQVWQGSAEVNFSLPIVFQAESSGYGDVIRPIKDLLKLTMPKDSAAGGGGLFEAPGPRINVDKLRERIGSLPSLPTPGPQQPNQGQQTQAADDNGSGALGQLWDTLKGGVNSAVDGARSVKDNLGSLTNAPIQTILKGATTLGAGARDVVNKSSVSVSQALINSIEGNISLYIGSFLYFPSVVITDVSQTYNVQITPDGNPARAQVNVSFKTFVIPTQDDLDMMFYAHGGAGGSSGGQMTDLVGKLFKGDLEA